MGIAAACRSICVALAFSTLALSTLSGCAAGYNLQVSLDPEYARQLGDTSVSVHVVPVNPHDRSQLEELSLNSYWGYKKPRQTIAQEQDTKKLELSSEHPQATVVDDDPIWKQWQAIGATDLMILTNLPIPSVESPGESDPRRRLISSNPSAWQSHDVKVVVTEGGLRVQTAENTENSR